MKHIKNPKNKEIAKFIGLFSLIFFMSFLLLYGLGFVPKEIKVGESKPSALDNLKLRILNNADSVDSLGQASQVKKEVVALKPTRIKIPKVSINVVVQNAESSNVSVLDQLLTLGTVRYPGSGLIGSGNMLIFGHSSNWKVVQNSAYKALNGIEKLVAGDEIYLESGDETFLYKVTSERLVDASEELVDFSNNKDMLTLSTCNTFGKKQDRYVVEADFVGKVNL